MQRERMICPCCDRVVVRHHSGLCAKCRREARDLYDCEIDAQLEEELRRHDQRIADHIDGYDRDDLGESLD
jgi:hypothetical protein